MYLLSSPRPRLVADVSAEKDAVAATAPDASPRADLDLDLDLDFRPPVAAMARARRPPRVGLRMKPSVQPRCRTRFTSAFSPPAPAPPKSLSESCLFLSRGIDHRCCVSTFASKPPELGA